MTAYQKKKETEPNKKRAARPSRIDLGRLCAALFALLLLLSALPAAAETGVREPKFGDGLRASGGHNITAFISWALTHVDPASVPQDAVLPVPASSVGTQPWQYLYGTIRTKTTQSTLDSFYNNHYSEQMNAWQYSMLTEGWSRTGYATDCQGLLDAWLTYEQGESTDINVQMNYDYWCTAKGAIEDIDRPFVVGEALFERSEATGKMTHIGWVCGFDGEGHPLSVEARGISYGVVVTRVDHRKWTYRGLMTKVFSYPSADVGEPPEIIIPDGYFSEDGQAGERRSAAEEGFGGGSGTQADPYRISNAAQLNYLSSRVQNGHTYSGEYLILTADIVLNDYSGWTDWDLAHGPASDWTPIGTRDSRTDMHPFKGHFDGQGHSVRGLYFSEYKNSCAGLFGYVAGGGSVSNVSLEYSYIRALNNVGGIAGLVEGGASIENCRFSGRLEAELWTGGVVGFVQGVSSAPSVIGCASTGYVKGIYSVGGVIGGAYLSGAARCFNSGAVEASDHTGGAVGMLLGSMAENCYNSGEISGNTAIGGLIGSSRGGSISKCYSVGSVAFTETGGGAAGLPETDAEYCYFLDTSAPDNGVGTAENDTELRLASGYRGFDLVGVWRLGGEYPYASLRSNPHLAPPEFLPGDVDGNWQVAVSDAVLALRAAMGVAELTPERAARADIDGDGVVSASDAMTILRMALGIL